MDHEDPNAKREIRRAKHLAAKFASLEQELSTLEPFPAMDPALELDDAARSLATEWIEAHLDLAATSSRATNTHPVPGPWVRG